VAIRVSCRTGRSVSATLMAGSGGGCPQRPVLSGLSRS